MMDVSEATTVQNFWKKTLPPENAEEQALFDFRGSDFKSASYKDLHAQAHCTAAWLMRQGLQKGDTVAMFPGISMQHLVLDIALQYLGAVQLILPGDISPKTLEKVVQEHKPRYIFVHDAAQMATHNQFLPLKAQLEGLLINEVEVDELDPEKVVTFDRVVTHGKAAWREEVQQLEEMKAAVNVEDVYAREINENGNGSIVRFSDLIAATRKVGEVFRTPANQPLFVQIHAGRLLQRHAILAALPQRRKTYLTSAPRPEDFTSLKPGYHVLHPKHLKALHAALPGMLGNEEAEQKKFEKAAEVVEKKAAAEAEGKKNPFFNKLKYNTGNKKLYARVRGKLGGMLDAVILDQGEVDPEVKLFFEELGIEQVQP